MNVALRGRLLNLTTSLLGLNVGTNERFEIIKGETGFAARHSLFISTQLLHVSQRMALASE